jgi:hypothetical protein
LNEYLDGLQPSPSDPQDLGLIPLSIAAEWIGSGGSKVPLPHDDPRPWELAYGSLVAAACAGKLDIYGVLDGDPIIIPRKLFLGVSIYLVDFGRPLDAPFAPPNEKGAIFSKFFLRAIVYPGEEEWLYGHNDALLHRIWTGNHKRHSDPEWVQLQVRYRDVKKLWRFDQPQLRTRAVGRETRRRTEVLAVYRSLVPDIAACSVTRASEQLAAALDGQFPEEAPFKPRTIERYVREERRSQEK